MRRLVVVLLLLVAGLVAACGGSDKPSASSSEDATDALASVKPISTATVDGIFRINLDKAPAEIGNKVEFTFDGPLRSNGAGKLPSLDWKLAFNSGFSNFTSRVVSTGSNVFINLGGAGLRARRAERRARQRERGVDRQGRRARRGRARPARRRDGRQGRRRGRGRRHEDDALHGRDRRRRRARPGRELPPPRARPGGERAGRTPAAAHAGAARQGQEHLPVATLRDPGGR